MNDRAPQLPTDRAVGELRARVESGEGPKGSRIPPFATVAEEHNRSKATVGKAIQRLADAGVLAVLPNYGTFVAE